MLTRKDNLGYLIAGIGALVGLIGAFALPYVTGQINIDTVLGSKSFTVIDSFSDATSSAAVSPQSLNGSSFALPLGYGILWLAVVLTVGALAIALIRLVAASSFRDKSTWFAIGLIVAGAVSLIVQLYVAVDASSGNKMQQALGGGGGIVSLFASIHVSGSFGAGGWLFLLGTIAVIVGGVLGFVFKPATQQVMGTVPAWPPQGQVPQWPANDYPQQGTPTQYGQSPYPTQSYPQESYPPAQQPPQQQPPQW